MTDGSSPAAAQPAPAPLRFAELVALLDAAVGGPKAGVGVHGPFWRDKTRDQFVQSKVFGLALIQLGDGTGSNMVKALRGEAPFGADIGTPNAVYSRMPAGLPSMSAADIDRIEAWITAGCTA